MTYAKEAFKKVFEAPNTFASTMLVAMTDSVGSVEWFDWDPEILQTEIYERFGADASQDNMDKLNALLLALTTNQFYVSLEAFMFICNALGGEGANFAQYDPAEMDEMAWAVTEVFLNDMPNQPLADLFSSEIKHYIGKMAEYEGFANFPRPLGFGVMPKGVQERANAAADLGADVATAVISEQTSKVAEIEEEVATKLSALMKQVESLPLANADEESLKTFVGKPLQRKA